MTLQEDSTRTASVDEAAAEAFAGRVLEMFNNTAVTLMISLGQETGLFDALAENPGSTSAELAGAAGLQERYVREWLGTLVTGRVVDYDPASRTYTLPPEHAASLTTAAGTGNLAAFALLIPECAKVLEGLAECFRHGGGLPYSEFTRFHELMREDSRQVADNTLLQTTVPLVPGLAKRLEAGIDVADIGCGAGHALNVLARAFPASRFVGYDISEEALGMARQEAAEWGLGNVQFATRDAARLGEPGRFDFVMTIDSIHDQAHPADVLRNIAEALRPGGVYLCADIAGSSELENNMDHPVAPLLYALSTMHCMTVSLAYGGDGLGNMWGEELATTMLHEAGFATVEPHHVEGDIFNVYYVCQN